MAYSLERARQTGNGSSVADVLIQEADRRIFRQEVVALAAGEGVLVDARGLARIGIVPGAAATVTYSKVDSLSASAHDADTSKQTASEIAVDVEWPFYWVSTAGGTARVAGV